MHPSLRRRGPSSHVGQGEPACAGRRSLLPPSRSHPADGSVDAHVALRLGLQRLQRGEDGRARAVVGVVIEDDHVACDGQRAIGELLGGTPLLRALVRLDLVRDRVRVRVRVGVRVRVRVRDRVRVKVRARVRVRVRVSHV